MFLTPGIWNSSGGLVPGVSLRRLREDDVDENAAAEALAQAFTRLKTLRGKCLDRNGVNLHATQAGLSNRRRLAGR